MFTAIVWIGKYGSWSKGGFATQEAAAAAAATQIANGVFGDRDDLYVDTAGPK